MFRLFFGNFVMALRTSKFICYKSILTRSLLITTDFCWFLRGCYVYSKLCLFLHRSRGCFFFLFLIRVINYFFLLSSRMTLFPRQPFGWTTPPSAWTEPVWTTTTSTWATTSPSYWTMTTCLLYTSPSPRDRQKSRMPSSA